MRVTLILLLSAYYVTHGLAETRPAFQLPAVHRSRLPGTVYSTTTDRFAEARAVNGNLTLCMDIIPLNYIDYSSAVMMTTRDKISTLVTNAELQLSIMCGLLKVTAAGNLDWSTETKATEMEAVIVAQVVTEEHYLDVDCKSLKDNIISRALNGTLGDYFITSIMYGHQYQIKFRASYKGNMTDMKVKGKLKAELRQLTSAFTASLSGSGSWDEVNKKNDYDVSYQIVGDVELPTQAFDNVTQVLTYVQKENGKLMTKSRTDKGRALFYMLSPIEELREAQGLDRTVQSVAHVSEKDVKEALVVMDLAEEVYQQGKAMEARAKVFESCIPYSVLTGLSVAIQKYKDTYLEYKLNISAAVVSERKKEGIKVADCISLYEDNDNSPAKFRVRLENEFKYLSNMCSTMEALSSIGLSCLPLSVAERDFVVIHGLDRVYLLQYRSKLLDTYIKQWNYVILKMREKCVHEKKSNQTCLFIDCSFSEHFCTDDLTPVLRGIEGGWSYNVIAKEASHTVTGSWQRNYRGENDDEIFVKSPQ